MLLLESHKVVHVLTTDQAGEAVLVDELRALQRFEQVGAETEIEVKPEVVPGEVVRITGGPLAGISGIVEQRIGTVRVTVNIEILGQSVSVELDVGDMKVRSE